jgi:hypothetical protein
MSPLRLGGQTVRVEWDGHHVPCSVTWGGRRQRVTAVLQRWRVEGRWWDEPVARDYVKLLVEDGTLLLLAHDWMAEVWHIRRIYG